MKKTHCKYKSLITFEQFFYQLFYKKFTYITLEALNMDLIINIT